MVVVKKIFKELNLHLKFLISIGKRTHIKNITCRRLWINWKKTLHIQKIKHLTKISPKNQYYMYKNQLKRHRLNFLLENPLMVVRLTNSVFGVLHSGSKFFKLTDFKFKHVLTYVCLFEFNFSSKTHLTFKTPRYDKSTSLG